VAVATIIVIVAIGNGLGWFGTGSAEMTAPGPELTAPATE
jgi:hypothetical protein